MSREPTAIADRGQIGEITAINEETRTFHVDPLPRLNQAEIPLRHFKDLLYNALVIPPNPKEAAKIMKKACVLSLLLAWTLWTRTQTPTSDSWTPAPGFGSQQKCQSSMKEKLEMWRQFKDARFTQNSVTFTSTNSTMIYLCLPDAEDPRKPNPAKPNL